MNMIYKYPFSLETPLVIPMPVGAKILSVQPQGHRKDDDLVMWALVDTDKPTEERVFILETTGKPLENIETLEYITTLQFINGAYIIHIFEKKG